MNRITSTSLLLASLLPLGAVACLPPSDAMVVVEPAPPPVRVEVYGVAPGPGYYWIAGYWAWGGTEYFWTPGRWVLPPRGYARYEAGRWQRHGSRWYWREGKWKRR
jgi:hypothetical protein